MKESPQYKRFKHINITGDTLSLSDTRLSVSDRAILALSYADTVIFSSHTLRPGIQKVKTVHLIIEMMPFLVYYSYVTKYHKLTSMFIPGYQCSNVYINVEKGTLMNKDIQ